MAGSTSTKDASTAQDKSGLAVKAGVDKTESGSAATARPGTAPAGLADLVANVAAPARNEPVNKPSQPSGPSRVPYTPQFSAATQMILKRMRGETAGSAPATPSAAPKPKHHPPGTYQSVRESFVFSTSGSKSVTPPPAASSSSATSTPATLRLPAPSTAKPSAGSLLTLASNKRKRAADETSESSFAEASDYGEGIRQKAPRLAAPTTTKSGRHILKPDTYDPAAEDNAKKRNQLGKRTAEQALCKKCTRMHSPATNQMVFCDGCNDPWHQRCHEPWIEDETVKDLTMKWYCARCAPKREKLVPKKKLSGQQQQQQPAYGAWPKASEEEKRAYFNSLTTQELIRHLMYATVLHPDLPIFPVEAKPKKAAAAAAASPQGTFASASAGGLFSRGDANPTARMNYIRKVPAHVKKSTIAKARAEPGSLQSKAAAQAQSSRSSGHQLLPEEEDPSFTKLWPKPGKGLYSHLVPDEDDDSQLVDGNDYNAFSVIVFDERGKKVEENGVKV